MKRVHSRPIGEIRKPKIVVLLVSLVCLLLVGLPAFAGCVNTSTSKSDNVTRSDDALWIYTGSRYLDLQRNGEFLAARGNRNSGIQEVRTGKLSMDITNKAFDIINTSAVLNARDTDPGEQILSQSEWGNIGIMVNQEVKPTSPWGYTEEIEDYPLAFQQLLIELNALAKTMPLATPGIEAFLFAETVSPQRAQSIKDDPRRFYEFVVLDENDMNSVPVVKNAIQMLSRQIPVYNVPELQKIEEYIKLSNLKSTGKEFFITVSDRSYQLHLLLTN